MRCAVAFPCSLMLPRLTIVAAITFSAAACSSNTARFSDGDGTPRNARPAAEVTGSMNSQPSPAISSSTLPPPAPPPQGAQSLAPPMPAPQAVMQQPVAPISATPPAARVAANTPAKAAPSSLAIPARPSTTHTVAAGDTLHKIARQYQVSMRDLIGANNLERHAALKVGSQLAIPGAKATQVAAQKPPAPAKTVATAQPNTPAQPPATSVNKMTPVPGPIAENQGTQVAPTLSFRRPVNARVISGFGPKPSGTENLGVNFAVPEGTPIKAAEDGVVAYASSELKSFGNLAMIRHANGYVTTYAHLSEILVKRDEPVKRGQVIGKSGQTGNVGSPQLHFEIRKGATPVDPMPFLERSPQ